MKIFMIECTEDELRANRGIMDAIVDACQRSMDSFFGTITPCHAAEQEDEPQVEIYREYEESEAEE